MIDLGVLSLVGPGIVLFVYGIAHFSSEMQKVAGERFRSAIKRLTRDPLRGALLGAGVTSLVQSSTATTTITVGLVNAGIISFAASLGVIIGANVGTTITSQIVALHITGFGSFFMVFGFLLSIIPGPLRFIGKPLFYFGLVFFSLNLISGALLPLGSDPDVVSSLSALDNVFLAILAGFLLTNLVQSSSVATGLVVLLSSAGILTLGQGIPLILGANIGTTTTALLSSMGMGLHARRVAVSHLLINLLGVMLFLPFIGPFTSLVAALGGDGARQMANDHLLFNLSVAAIFLICIDPFSRVVQALVPGREKEILLSTRNLSNGDLPESNDDSFALIEGEIGYSLEVTIDLFDSFFDLVRSPSPQNSQKVSKLESLSDYLDQRISDALLSLSSRKLTSGEAERILLLTRISNVIERIADNAQSMSKGFSHMQSKGLALSKEGESELCEVYSDFRKNLKALSASFPGADPALLRSERRRSRRLEKQVIKSYSLHIVRLKSQKAYSGSAFVDLISAIDSANAKLGEVVQLTSVYAKMKGGS